jgi:hypothetical protein
MTRSTLRDRARLTVLAGALATAAACGGSGDPVVPVPRPQPFYTLLRVDNLSLPYRTWENFGVREFLVEARLSPLSTGRGVDERLVGGRNDGSTGGGGGTRDTTVAVGQMSDVRLYNTSRDATLYRDSTVVDVVLKDTVFIITRSSPVPGRARVDTGYLVNDMLVVPTLNDRNADVRLHAPMLLVYQLRRIGG